MSTVSNAPKEYITKKRYLGSLFANSYWMNSGIAQHRDGIQMYPARPERYHSFISRALQAIDVFFGRADAIYWWEDFQK